MRFGGRPSYAFAAFLASASFLTGAAAYAAGAGDIEDLSLEALLNEKISVASTKPTTAREAPGIVTLITRQEIRASGARDLLDVLNLVPGFFFGQDVTGVVGPGFRGLWGFEGKILLLWDGQEMNEMGYATLQLGGHFPVDVIERVEIIRGPGSAIYGGSAELAVINVITRNGAGFEGVEAVVRAGATQDVSARRAGSVLLGKKFGDGWYFGGSLAVQTAPRSDRTYLGIDGVSYDMESESDLTAANINLILSSEAFRLRFLFDDYNVYERQSYGTTRAESIPINTRTYSSDVQYEIKPSDTLSITPYVSYKAQQPWRSKFGDPATDPDYYDALFQRFRIGARGSWDALDQFNLVAGVEGDLTTGQYGPGMAVKGYVFVDGTNDISYKNFAAYAQGTASFEPSDSAKLNLTAGARVEDHEQYGASFVPRGAITAVWDRFNLKALASQAFRTPVIENINTTPDIQPEKTTVYEVGVGCQITDQAYLSANFFDITIKKPIVYYVSGGDQYLNLPRTGSQGMEAEFRFNGGLGTFAAGYSLYRTAGKNRVDVYDVPGVDGILLGSANHKVTAQAGAKIYKGLSLEPSYVFLSKRYGYGPSGTPLTPQLMEFDPVSLVNVQLRYRDLFYKGLSVSLGAYNLLDENAVLIQPYFDQADPAATPNSPLPGPSREFALRLSYTWEPEGRTAAGADEPAAATPSATPGE